MGSCALHTVIGQNSRCRKELEPSRRLSETTGPQSPSAFRIAFRVTEVTERAARCKRAARHFTHRAPAAWRYHRATAAGSHVTADPRARIRELVCKAMLPSLTRYRARTDRSCSCYRSASTTTTTGGLFVDHRGAREALRDSAPLAALGDIAHNQRSCGRALRPARCRCILQWTSEQHGIGAEARAPFSWTSRLVSRTARLGSTGTMTPGAFIATRHPSVACRETSDEHR